jgi:hypothetical protein
VVIQGPRVDPRDSVLPHPAPKVTVTVTARPSPSSTATPVSSGPNSVAAAGG